MCTSSSERKTSVAQASGSWVGRNPGSVQSVNPWWTGKEVLSNAVTLDGKISAVKCRSQNPYLESIFLQNKNWLRVQALAYTTLRLVRISLLTRAITKSFAFFSRKLFYKSNRKLFSSVCIAWYKHERGWENSRQLCKPSTSSRVCISVSDSPNPSRIRLCKHVKRFLLLKSDQSQNTN